MIYLEYLLRKYHIQQKDLAEELGIKKQNINIWFNKKQSIPQKYLPVLSEMFNVAPDDLQKDVETVFAEDVCNIIEYVYFGNTTDMREYRVNNGSNGSVRLSMDIIRKKYVCQER